MQEYRVYCLDGAGHISLAEWISADSDKDAIHQAQQLKRTVKREVWQGHRLVAAIDEHLG
jgi:hypothetical protein